MGVSQGGLMARSILEDCDVSPNTKVRNLLTIGSPNMGISELPALGCNTDRVSANMSFICSIEHAAMVSVPYTEFSQHNLAAAGYVRNTADYGAYLKGATFLPALNNEVGEGTPTYERHKQRIESLNAAMFVEFTQDEIVFPPISEIFGEVTPQTAGFDSSQRETTPMENTKWY